jgi:8-oxo-dGTP diphosphatase
VTIETEHTHPRPPESPRVGVGAIVLRDDKVLLGKRLGSLGTGTWALPGGHLEFGETVEACARRELLEESGLALGDIAHGPYTNDIFPDVGRHYITLFVVATGVHGEPQCLEPTKCAEWRWFAWDDLPQPLFAPLDSLRRTGFDPSRQNLPQRR